MPATPRWLLAVPDAIRQLETLDRDLLTRLVAALRQARLTGIRVAVPRAARRRPSGSCCRG